MPWIILQLVLTSDNFAKATGIHRPNNSMEETVAYRRMLVRLQLGRNSKMKTLLTSNIFSGAPIKQMEVPGCIKAEPMTKALTLQFMNGLGHSLTSVEYVLYIPLARGGFTRKSLVSVRI